MIENFVLLIVLLLVNALLCIKRIPIFNIIFGLMTFFITTMVFLSDSELNIYVVLFSALMGTMALILGALEMNKD